MKKVFFDAVRSERKTTTVRYWRRQMVRPGEIHTVPGLGRVRIEAVEEVELPSLTDSAAADDGFASADELRAALEEMYPGLAGGGETGRRLYVVRFTFLRDGG